MRCDDLQRTLSVSTAGACVACVACVRERTELPDQKVTLDAAKLSPFSDAHGTSANPGKERTPYRKTYEPLEGWAGAREQEIARAPAGGGT